MIKILGMDGKVHFYERLDDVPEKMLDAPLLYDADDVRAMMMAHGTDGGPYSTARVLVDICGRQGARGV